MVASDRGLGGPSRIDGGLDFDVLGIRAGDGVESHLICAGHSHGNAN
jgi:hypothetical protein